MKPLLALTAVETKMFLRDPGAVIFGVFFPSLLLIGLGSLPMLRTPAPEFGGLRFIDVWAPTALVYSVVMIGAQHVPNLIAAYRERGILRRMSTTPVHPRNLLLAQLIIAVATNLVSAALLITSAWVIFDITPPQRPATFALAFLIGISAVLAISMINGALARTAAVAASWGALIFMVLMFFGGGFLPRFLMPDALVRVGQFMPPGIQSMVDTWTGTTAEVTATSQPLWVQLGIMVVIAVVAATIAARLFRWE